MADQEKWLAVVFAYSPDMSIKLRSMWHFDNDSQLTARLAYWASE
jgi:hypothetical protein